METRHLFPSVPALAFDILSTARQVFIWLLLIIVCGHSIQAQNNIPTGSGIRFSKTMAIVMEKTIPFGSKLGMDALTETTSWEIMNAGGSIASGTGNGLNEYVFNTPGNYEVSIHENITFEPGSCQHNSCPDMIQLKVTNTKMTFHFNEITFSEPIRVEIETAGTSMHVPVTIERYNSFLPMENLYAEVKTAGIQTDITATLAPGTTLREGKQTLVYELSGKAHKPAYLMFDFMDINGMVQSYAMPFPIAQ